MLRVMVGDSGVRLKVGSVKADGRRGRGRGGGGGAKEGQVVRLSVGSG